MLMIVVMYALFDRKLREYGAPLVAANDDVMWRELRHMGQTGSFLDKYPEDFDLQSFGTMDTETGKVTLGESIRFVGNVRDVLSREE